MSIKVFFELVEIKTKLASLLPFVFAVLFTLYSFGEINGKNTFFMFVSLLFFDMTTTTINNYMDYVKASDDDYKKQTNVIGRENISVGAVRVLIFVMLFIAIGFGLMLVKNSSVVVLFLGVASFFVGVFYTYGPIPISRMPLGELFSGFFMGFVIIFITVYISNPNIIGLLIVNTELVVRFDIIEIIKIGIVSIPFVFAISNLMLANNICDLEQDKKNNRFLLPYYIGVDNSLMLYKCSYYVGYIAIIFAVILSIFPTISLIGVLSFIVVNKNIKVFLQEQIKSKTFVLAVKNLMIIGISMILPLVIYFLFRIF